MTGIQPNNDFIRIGKTAESRSHIDGIPCDTVGSFFQVHITRHYKTGIYAGVHGKRVPDFLFKFRVHCPNQIVYLPRRFDGSNRIILVSFGYTK